ncbi:MAG: respiratory nitrate reductase subunit gamma [Alphaproteobacteria bacterium]|nr:respiratory nitrate reductase subunit gamma [Alphaproteobacteria bacterium]MBU6472725.1 respiratory nitrate reductase subunit gamma [Alphaproteobacteria bacterium]MDE2012926.1 respiratory nitrate reductase subunit gamma [Alphaproteobacteria bacterium]MDE2074066.1 respiratory nitrate reductase subunit gamma [Alphaproteobacteria bacterium]MDE2350724.1 respiratory nitrate reductase subunit gamma [Alphaproteobacteria bacterium]
MSIMTVSYALLLYAATVIFALGLCYRVFTYARTPAPLKIPTMPAPVTRAGVVFRMVREVGLFESLFKSSKWTWIFAVMFHLGLLLEVLRHLRYFIQPLWFWVVLVQPFGVYGGMAMVAGLAGLFARRLLVARVRYVSQPSDYLMLILLLGIGGSGLAVKFLDHTDIVSFKAFVLGLLYFDWQPLPANPLLLTHLALVSLLLIVFPFSKLLHAPAVFFSPTRNQVDDARERRHLAPWAARLERAGGEV